MPGGDEFDENLKKIAIVGVAGRMGRMLLEVVAADSSCQLVGGSEHKGSAFVGCLLGDLLSNRAGNREWLDLSVVDDAEPLFREAQVVIDFTLPDATDRHLDLACAYGTGFVLGTTGLNQAQIEKIEKSSLVSPVLQAANFSLGVNLILNLVKQASCALPAIDWDIEIAETHHNRKIDAPSGTALALGEAAAMGRSVKLEEVARLSREGQSGSRPSGEIGFATMRGGDVVGEHQVGFFGSGERIEISHRATDRNIFARGALHAAKWLAGRKPGLYTMEDVLQF